MSNFDSRHVHGKSCNRPQIHTAGKSSAVILRPPTVNVNRLIFNVSVGIISAFKCGGEYERFKRGAGLTNCHSRAVELIRTASAYHRLYITCFRVYRNYRALRLLNTVCIGVIAGQIFQECRFSHSLHIHINRRVNFQAVFINCVRAVFIDHQLRNVIYKIRRVLEFFRSVRGSKDNFRIFRVTFVGSVYEMIFDHLSENGISTFLSRLKIVERRIIIRAFRNTCQKRTFRQSQFLNIFIEVSFSRRLNSVRTLTEINLIQIHFQNFLLGILFFELKSQKNFLNFSFDSAFLREISIFRKLLSDGRAAFRNFLIANVSINCAK